MEARSAKKPLCSLSEWSERHIRDVFEARSEKKCLRAISSTFADGVNASINGIPLSREGINQLVLGMRRSSSGGLKVHWQQATEVPGNPATYRDGSFGGVYIIRGIQKRLPGTQKPIAFERHKTVTVKIESQSSSSRYDSRKIVSLVFVASDIRVDCQTSS